MNILSRMMLTTLLIAGTAHVAKAESVGPDQVLTIRTVPEEAGAAHCELSNAAGNNNIYLTPGRVDIMKASGSLDIRCMSSNGLWVGHMQLKAKMGGSFENIVNLPFTGLAAANNVLNDFEDPVAQSVGSAVTYPSTIIVPLHSIVHKINDAQFADESEAISNAPEVATPVEQPVTKTVKKHKAKAHHIYHVEESHS